MDCIHQTGVVPVLDHIVGSVMDHHPNCVSAVVYQEDDVLLPISDHGGHILNSHLLASEKWKSSNKLFQIQYII